MAKDHDDTSEAGDVKEGKPEIQTEKCRLLPSFHSFLGMTVRLLSGFIICSLMEDHNTATESGVCVCLLAVRQI